MLAVASMQADPIAMKASELMRLGKMPSASDIKGGVVRYSSRWGAVDVNTHTIVLVVGYYGY